MLKDKKVNDIYCLRIYEGWIPRHFFDKYQEDTSN